MKKKKTQDVKLEQQNTTKKHIQAGAITREVGERGGWGGGGGGGLPGG